MSKRRKKPLLGTAAQRKKIRRKTLLLLVGDEDLPYQYHPYLTKLKGRKLTTAYEKPKV